MYEKIKYLSAGDKAVVMEFGNEISKEINAKIRNVVKLLDEAKIDGIVELLPTYRSLMIMYDPLKIEYSELISTLDSMSSKQVESSDEKIRIVEFPTVYGGEYGPDINFVAEHNNITVDEVIKIHTGTDLSLIHILTVNLIKR